MTTPFLIIPGWAGSGPDHWQTHWEQTLPDARRVEMPDWLHPRREAWTAALDRAVRSTGIAPILVAHSLGCVAVAHWASRSTASVRGALLVAPADVDRRRVESLADFSPVPRARLRFPSRIIASDNDPFATLEYAARLASDWGSELTVLERAGHINVASGFGHWPEGLMFARAFLWMPAIEEPDEAWIQRGID
jgi:predicted alpha/beta hydrolase family esterase